MTNRSGAPVVVGVDGSISALDAVRVATREAVARNRPLRVVHAYIWPLLGTPLASVPGGPPDAGLRDFAEHVVAEAVAEAKKISAEVDVTGEIINGAVTPALLRESTDAALLVLGSRGLGGFTELLVGSSAVHLSASAGCPVVVVRGEPRADGPVLVGVDGSEISAEAVGFAFEEAALRDTDLVAVHTWLYPPPIGLGDVAPMPHAVDELIAEEERVLAATVAEWSQRYPQVRVRQRLLRGPAARVLIEESASAQLTVVGAHGRGAWSGLLLGSVSHAVLHHARSPLAIVRHRKAPRG